MLFARHSGQARPEQFEEPVVSEGYFVLPRCAVQVRLAQKNQMGAEVLHHLLRGSSFQDRSRRAVGWVYASLYPPCAESFCDLRLPHLSAYREPWLWRLCRIGNRVISYSCSIFGQPEVICLPPDRSLPRGRHSATIPGSDT
jgi:hypothetical protein